MAKAYVICADHQTHAHLTRDPEKKKALCGKRAFPENWYQVLKTVKPICAACRGRL